MSSFDAAYAPFPDEALLMRPEILDSLPGVLAFGPIPIEPVEPDTLDASPPRSRKAATALALMILALPVSASWRILVASSFP